MHRLPNQFHTPASQAQAAAGGGCTTSTCCVITVIGSSIFGAIHFTKIKAEQTQDQETLQNISEASQSVEASSSLSATENVLEASPSSENKSQIPDTRIVRGLLGFFALPFALYAAFQLGLQLNFDSFGFLFFTAALLFTSTLALAHYLARSSPLRGVVVGILWMICLTFIGVFEIVIWFSSLASWLFSILFK